MVNFRFWDMLVLGLNFFLKVEILVFKELICLLNIELDVLRSNIIGILCFVECFGKFFCFWFGGSDVIGVF